MNPAPKPKPKKQKPRFHRLRLPKYQAWIRGQRCLLYAGFFEADLPLCWGHMEADHVRTRGAGGPDAGNLVPLCTVHHSLKHSMGIKSFSQAIGKDLAMEAKFYWEAYQAEQI